MFDVGKIQPEVEYKGWGISTVQERDGTWIAYVASQHDTTAPITGVAPLIQKSQSYLARSLAIVDLEIQIDELENNSPAAPTDGDQDASTAEGIEPKLLLAYEPIAEVDTAADIHEPDELGSIDNFKGCDLPPRVVPGAETKSTANDGVGTLLNRFTQRMAKADK